jgi:hypothetical protein
MAILNRRVLNYILQLIKNIIMIVMYTNMMVAGEIFHTSGELLTSINAVASCLALTHVIGGTGHNGNVIFCQRCPLRIQIGTRTINRQSLCFFDQRRSHWLCHRCCLAHLPAPEPSPATYGSSSSSSSSRGSCLATA